MKLSQSLLKMITKILILLILFVCMFLISVFLYSARYWPDVYNYVNANITIKRIPTISELDIQIVEVEVDYTTETYSTTEAEYFEITAIDDFDIDNFMKDEPEIKTKGKRNIEVEEMKDYKELPRRGIFVDYIFLEEPTHVSIPENSEDGNDILKTVITDKIIDEEKSTDNNDVGNAQYTSDIIKEPYKDKHDDKPELTTTRENYLVGDDLQQEVNKEIIIDITTETYENDVDEDHTMIDLVDVSNLSTRGPEEVEYVSDNPDESIVRMSNSFCYGNRSCEEFTKAVHPWVVTIFIKNNTENSQFEYVCDGSLLSEKVIVTSGRCVLQSNKTVDPQNMLVFLGKGNLQFMSGVEKLYRIKEVILHQNFTNADGDVTNDLALLTMETPADLGDHIESACIHTNETGAFEEAGTTAWGASGQLLPIFFEKEKSDICKDKTENVFCATYGAHVALCPSYGGVFATKRDSTWCLQGIFYGDPADRGLCFNKNVWYTSLSSYFNWIDDIVNINKNVL